MGERCALVSKAVRISHPSRTSAARGADTRSEPTVALEIRSGPQIGSSPHELGAAIDVK